MNVLLKLEEGAIFLLCIFLFSKLNFAWWWFPALLLLPDIGMIGYTINPKIGAYHISLDRVLGYGLKYNDSFSNTHLGVIGKHGKN
ncbi:MAG: DUF4260 family protein [Segetibacter sp.]